MKTDTRTILYLPSATKRAVHQAAEALGISESEWIRRAIECRFAAQDSAKPARKVMP